MKDSNPTLVANAHKKVSSPGAESSPRWHYRLAARLFGGEAVEEVVSTEAIIEGSPIEAWGCLMTYEEIPVKASWLLRWLLPQPIGTSGDKTKPGEQVPCTYVNGGLVKQIVTVSAPSELTFVVLNQKLGVEDCMIAVGGSYHIVPDGSGSRITLLTRYEAKLHPRWFWRPVEEFLAHRFHLHVLSGMKDSLRGKS